MSAPTLSDIFLPPQVNIVYDHPALETFYEQLLMLMNRWTSSSLSIVLHYNEPNQIVVNVNGSIFARLSIDPRLSDAECLVKNLLLLKLD